MSWWCAGLKAPTELRHNMGASASVNLKPEDHDPIDIDVGPVKVTEKVQSRSIPKK